MPVDFSPIHDDCNTLHKSINLFLSKHKMGYIIGSYISWKHFESHIMTNRLKLYCVVFDYNLNIRIFKNIGDNIYEHVNYFLKMLISYSLF